MRGREFAEWFRYKHPKIFSKYYDEFRIEKPPKSKLQLQSK